MVGSHQGSVAARCQELTPSAHFPLILCDSCRIRQCLSMLPQTPGAQHQCLNPENALNRLNRMEEQRRRGQEGEGGSVCPSCCLALLRQGTRDRLRLTSVKHSDSSARQRLPPRTDSKARKWHIYEAESIVNRSGSLPESAFLTHTHACSPHASEQNKAPVVFLTTKGSDPTMWVTFMCLALCQEKTVPEPTGFSLPSRS